MGLGAFAGGLMTGYLAMQANQRANDEADIKRREFDWKQKEQDEKDATEAAVAEGFKPTETAPTGFKVGDNTYSSIEAANEVAAAANEARRREDPNADNVQIQPVGGGTQLATPSQAYKRAGQLLAEKGLGLKASAMNELYNRTQKEEVMNMLAKASMTGNPNDLTAALAHYSENIPDGYGAKAVQLPDKDGYPGKIAIVYHDQADPKKEFWLGGKSYDSVSEAATALHTMVKGAPLDYLKLDKSDDLRRDLALQQEQLRRDIAADRNKTELARTLAQIEARLAGLDAHASGSGGKGTGADAPFLMDRRAFNDAMGYKDDNAAEGDRAYSYYSQLYSAASPQEKANQNSNANYQRLSRQLATGTLRPYIGLDPNTLQWRYQAKDERGNVYPLEQSGTRPDAIDTLTGRPFYTPEQIQKEESTVLANLARTGSVAGTPFDAVLAIAADPEKRANIAMAATGKMAVNGKVATMPNTPQSQEVMRSAQTVLRAADLVAKYGNPLIAKQPAVSQAVEPASLNSLALLDKALSVTEVPTQEEGITKRVSGPGRVMGYRYRGINFHTMEDALKAKAEITAPSQMGATMDRFGD